MQENEPEEYINEVSLDSDEQAEAGPPPYESVMMSGYDGVWLSMNKLTCSHNHPYLPSDSVLAY